MPDPARHPRALPPLPLCSDNWRRGGNQLARQLHEVRLPQLAGGWGLGERVGGTVAISSWVDSHESTRSPSLDGCNASSGDGAPLLSPPLSVPLQVLSLTLITANGTTLTVTPTSNPHLFRALGVSVGRLGVVTELTLRIRPQMAVTKSLQVRGG